MKKNLMSDFQKNNTYVIRNKDNKDFYLLLRTDSKQELTNDFDKATPFSYNYGSALLVVLGIPKLQLVKVRTVLNEIEQRRTKR